MMQRRILRGTFTLLAIVATAATAQGQQLPGRWSAERAMAWERETGWLVGSNYAPQSAINQLDMWQAESWDPRTIDRELGWARGLGMNTMRVFLHDLAYKQDPQGFLNRVDEFLAIADRHKIRPMLVLFDAVWDPFPRLGPQRQPVPGLHNSGWLQSPGVEILRDSMRHRELDPYVKGVVGRFANDRRIVAWDLFNEPDNRNGGSYGAFEPVNKGEMALALLRRTFQWAREMNPTQPLTAGPWKGDYVDPSQTLPITTFMLENSDVITFHSYDDLPNLQRQVAVLQRLGRPVLCTEYMARPRGSTFESILPYFKQQAVDAYNWGFVSGESQTIYPWDSWQRAYPSEPPVWFHDIFRPDGTPYRQEEVQLIRSLTGARR
ncbi:MAG: cellulase family glycosylhydrolase [Gemmatimonadetes bacterium]|nr:cellulase family glycosylhydrolase [Gemmatimonadota bacterium]